MKGILITFTAALIFIVISACSMAGYDGNQANSKSSPTFGYKNIKPDEAKKRLEDEKGIILLDMRTQQEYAREAYSEQQADSC